MRLVWIFEEGNRSCRSVEGVCEWVLIPFDWESGIWVRWVSHNIRLIFGFNGIFPSEKSKSGNEHLRRLVVKDFGFHDFSKVSVLGIKIKMICGVSGVEISDINMLDISIIGNYLKETSIEGLHLVGIMYTIQTGIFVFGDMEEIVIPLLGLKSFPLEYIWLMFRDLGMNEDLNPIKFTDIGSICKKRMGQAWVYIKWLRAVYGTQHNYSSQIGHNLFLLLTSLLSLVCWCSVEIKFSFSRFLIFIRLKMSQSGLLGKDSAGKSAGAESMKMRIKVPHFDNSALIEGYSRTLIGRCMNPSMQDMNTLLFMLPRIWKMEERVIGADLGLGRFQFDFDREEDIAEVMKMEPFHFDHWMVSLVRWKPVVDPKYPSAIKFWIRVLGIPLQFWADATFRTIGSALGDVKEVDLDSGRVQVIVNGFEPLCFETVLEFHSGEETVVFLRYERLFGFCRRCRSLCHDQTRCPTRRDEEGSSGPILPVNPGQDSRMLSYKAAASQGLASRQNEGVFSGQHISRATETQQSGHEGLNQVGGTQSRYGQNYKFYKGKKDRRFGEGTSNQNNNQNTVKQQELELRYAISNSGLNQLKHPAMGTFFSDHEQKMLDAFHSGGKGKEGTKEKGEVSLARIPEKQVRKQLFSGEVPASTEAVTEVSQEPTVADMNSTSLGDGQMVMMSDAQPTMAAESKNLNVILVETGTDEGTVYEEGELKDNEDEMVTDWDQSSKVHRDQEDSEEKRVGTADEEPGNKGNRQKSIKTNIVLKGVSSKKRNVQVLTSPRKRAVYKNGVRINEETLKAGTGVKQNGGIGKKGGMPPPISTSD